MDEDAFDRAVRREQELRARVERGDIDDEEAEVLRALGARGDDEGLRLTLDQAARLVDEWVDVATLAALLRAWPKVTFDEAIDLISSYSIDRDAIDAFVHAGIGADVDSSTLEELFANEIDPAVLARMRDEGIDIDQVVTDGHGGRARRDSSLSLNLKLGGRRVLLGAGETTIRESGVVTGMFVGDLRVVAGAEVELLGMIIGDVHVEDGGSFNALGIVVGDVHHLGPSPAAV